MINIAKKTLVDPAKEKIVEYAKKQFMSEFEKIINDDINNIDEGINKAFTELTKTLSNNNFVVTVRNGICKETELAEIVKTELNVQIVKIMETDEFKKMQEKMKEKVEEISDDNMKSVINNKIDTLQATLKLKIEKLINDIIDCNAPSSSTGGKRNRNTKRKHRKKTKKHYKKSRSRK
jgi:hypothetical protein